MGITKYIKKVCVQTAVYWGSPVNDGYGKYTFATAVELTPPNGVRWEETTAVVTDNNGKEIISKAKILIVQDVEEQGYLYLGALDDLDSDPDPMEVEGAYEIIRVDKTPLYRATDKFVRTIYLGYGANR